MHEYEVTRQIIETALCHAERHGGSRVSKIQLVMGESCGYLADSILLYFDIIAEDTSCAGAKIDIEAVKPKLKCKVCGKLFERKPFEFSCTNSGCKGEGEPTEIGREFYIAAIEFL
ncbi:MAG: hydrogenase maturation nickel metallochaperone HypA [Oscillospiraceae bacterium]|nr:hydrogenase maturation nickel metallochaperone HypA [Oscillospiraceae bacterium]